MLSREVRHVQLLEQISDDIIHEPQFDDMRCTAIEVCTAIVEYLVVGVKYLKSSFGREFSISISFLNIFSGNVLKNLLCSDDYEMAIKRIDSAINAYNSSLNVTTLIAVIGSRQEDRRREMKMDKILEIVLENHTMLKASLNSDLPSPPRYKCILRSSQPA